MKHSLSDSQSRKVFNRFGIAGAKYIVMPDELSEPVEVLNEDGKLVGTITLADAFKL